MSDRSKGKVLIVDDEDMIVSILSSLLNKYGHETVTALNGQLALDILNKDNNIVCVLSDIRMPVMDGISLVKNTRDNGNSVPFILFTGYGTDEHINEAKRYGVYKVIVKPDYGNLQTTILSAINSVDVNNTEKLETA
jgi:adenylate cyclase